MGTFVCPGLFESASTVQADIAPRFARWLRRAGKTSCPPGYYTKVLSLFAYQDATYNLAQLRAEQDGLDSAAFWLCADPMSLAVDLSHIYSLGTAGLDFDADESAAYIAYLNAALPKGVTLVAATPLRWYLRLQTPSNALVCEPYELLGKTLRDKMPVMAPELMQLYNEVQMLLHTCDLNQARRADNKPTLDALWFWGGGALLAPSSECRWDRVITNDPIVQALAALNNIPCDALKTASLGQLDFSKKALLVDDSYLFEDPSTRPYQYLSDDLLEQIQVLYSGNETVFYEKTWRQKATDALKLNNFVN